MENITSRLPDHIICHYAEIGIKGKNRDYFERRLKENIKYAVRLIEPGLLVKTMRIQGRILLRLSEAGQNRIEDILTTLGKIFGIAYFAPVYQIDPDLDVFNATALEMLSAMEFENFRISTRKADRNFAHSAHRVNELVGAHIVDNLGKKVRLKNPEVNCRIDLFYNSAFIYTRRIEGPGGLPVGVSGNIALMLSGGIDSPVAAYYALKRGANLVAIHFHSMPYTTETALEKVEQLAGRLNHYQPRIKLILVALTPIQQEILVKTDEKYRVILYRRFMFRITEALARKEGLSAIVTGESLGQVASQTIENMAVIEECTNIPVLRPLIGMDKKEIIELAGKIDTYDISIQPHIDCCTLFVPKHPATKARLIDIERSESNLDVDGLVGDAVNSAETRFISSLH